MWNKKTFFFVKIKILQYFFSHLFSTSSCVYLTNGGRCVLIDTLTSFLRPNLENIIFLPKKFIIFSQFISLFSPFLLENYSLFFLVEIESLDENVKKLFLFRLWNLDYRKKNAENEQFFAILVGALGILILFRYGS